MDSLPVGEPPEKGLRAWTVCGLERHGLKRTNIPAHTGGTIIYQDCDALTFAVQWDSSQTTVHSAFDFVKQLICIGAHHTFDDYLRYQTNSRSAQKSIEDINDLEARKILTGYHLSDDR